MKSFIPGLIIGFIVGAILAYVLYFFLLLNYDELDLHDIPSARMQYWRESSRTKWVKIT